MEALEACDQWPDLRSNTNIKVVQRDKAQYLRLGIRLDIDIGIVEVEEYPGFCCTLGADSI